MINKIVQHAQIFIHLGLSFSSSDPDTLHLVVYADASFAINEDLSSQLGFIVLLVEGAGKVVILSFASQKSKRLVRSALRVEIFDFTADDEAALLIRHDLRTLLQQYIPLRELAYSSSLFSFIIRSTTTTDRLLMVNL